jgi:hypothetical protein
LKHIDFYVLVSYIQISSPNLHPSKALRSGAGGKTPYKGGEDYNCGSKEDFDPGDEMPQGDNGEQQQQEIDNDEEEDKVFDPEGGRNHHNTRSVGQPYNIPPRGQQ